MIVLVVGGFWEGEFIELSEDLVPRRCPRGVTRVGHVCWSGWTAALSVSGGGRSRAAAAAALRVLERSAATTALACWYGGGGGGGVLVGERYSGGGSGSAYRCMRCSAIYSEVIKITKEEVMLALTFLLNLLS